MYSSRPGFRFESNQFKIATMDSNHFRFSISDGQLKSASRRNSFAARQSKIGNRRSPKFLSLRELETLARALLSVLLAFFNTRIAGNQSGLLQSGPQVAVIFNQGACNAVANRPCLTGRAAAGHVDQHVELGRGFRQVKRLTNNHPVCFVGKVRLESFSVDQEIACARSQIDSSGRSLSPPGSVVLNIWHVLILCLRFSTFDSCVKGVRGFAVTAPNEDARRQHRLLTS